MKTININRVIFPRRMAFIIALTAAFFCTNIGSALAQNTDGGFIGPGPALISVEQAKTKSDDTAVALRGKIVQKLGDEDYLFQDASGTITAEIDDDVWKGLHVGADDLVEIHGEIDKEWTKIEIEVWRIDKVAP